MRSTLKCNILTSIRNKLEALRWLNIDQKLKLNTLLAIFKIKHGHEPRYLTNEVRHVGEVQPYQQ